MRASVRELAMVIALGSRGAFGLSPPPDWRCHDPRCLGDRGHVFGRRSFAAFGVRAATLKRQPATAYGRELRPRFRAWVADDVELPLVMDFRVAAKGASPWKWTVSPVRSTPSSFQRAYRSTGWG